MDYERIAKIVSEDSVYYREKYKSLCEFIMYLVKQYGCVEDCDYGLANAIKNRDENYTKTGIWMSDSFIASVLTCGSEITEKQHANRLAIKGVLL